MAQTSTEIIKLIRSLRIDEALDALDGIVPVEFDSDYISLRMKYVSQDSNFNEAEYIKRLVVFVNTALRPPKKGGPVVEENFYDEFCLLDFKLQTTHCQKIIPYKKIAAFLLHGETDQEVTDLRWLYNQLLHTWNLDEAIKIDCSICSSVEGILGELFQKFDVQAGNYNQSRIKLGRNLFDTLNEQHVVCVLKNANRILADDNELSKCFTDFINYMDDHVADAKHSLILLFLDKGVANYQPASGNYFFWFDQPEDVQYPQKAVGCGGQRIIDLAPINRLTAGDLKTWIDGSFERPSIYKKLKDLEGKVEDVIKAGDRPYQVIKTICTDLNIKFEDKWID